MIKTMTAEKNVELLRICSLMETQMSDILDKWNLDIDVEQILEEAPWLDESQAKLSVIGDQILNVFDLAEKLIDMCGDYFDTNVSNSKVRLMLYFKSPIIVAMKKIIDTEVGVSDNTFMAWRGRFSKAYTSLMHFIYNAFDVDDYINGKKSRIFEMYEAQYGSLEDLFKKIALYVSNNPLFLSYYVEKNNELFKRLLSNNPEVSMEDFENVSEAVMPWDIIMFNRGELEMNQDYINRLTKRLYDASSIFNDVPQIVDVIDTLPEELAKDLYKYENMIAVEAVEFLKSNKYTWEQILDFYKSRATTAYF